MGNVDKRRGSYKNPDIYEACNTANFLCNISFIITIIWAISELAIVTTTKKSTLAQYSWWHDSFYDSIVWDYICFLGLIFFSPITIKGMIPNLTLRKKSDISSKKWVFWLIFLSPWIFGAGFVGACLIPNIFLYIAAAKISKVPKLIQEEWNNDPPHFYADILAEKKEEEHEQNVNKSSALLKKCGMRFFIKYYKQIKFLPIKDIVVTENYSIKELEERLLSAKEIINSNLTETALKEILEKYGDFLSPDELQQAESILYEITSLPTQDSLTHTDTQEKENYDDNLPTYLQEDSYAFHKEKGLVKIYAITDNKIYVIDKYNKQYFSQIERISDFSQPFQVGDIVNHLSLGEVTVTDVTDITVTVTHKNNPPRTYAINDFAKNVLLYIEKKI